MPTEAGAEEEEVWRLDDTIMSSPGWREELGRGLGTWPQGPTALWLSQEKSHRWGHLLVEGATPCCYPQKAQTLFPLPAKHQPYSLSLQPSSKADTQVPLIKYSLNYAYQLAFTEHLLCLSVLKVLHVKTLPKETRISNQFQR
jgi:hypothetical protein